ncbi:MAG TPA: TetR/AcrR family transcriptional regulator [Solirubrobacterales bacterium]
MTTKTAPKKASVKPVADGVFFTLPESLPRGRHGLSREQVREAQTERLLAAATELLAARGYRGFGIGDIATRAGVSLETFYKCFESKDHCVFAGYDRFIDVLLQKMVAIEVTPEDRLGYTTGLLDAYLATLQEDLVVARAYQVEIDAAGTAARARRRDSLTLFAKFIREEDARASDDGQPSQPWSAYIGVVYAARQLASDALDASANPDLSALGEDLRVWMSDLFGDRPPRRRES